MFAAVENRFTNNHAKLGVKADFNFGVVPSDLDCKLAVQLPSYNNQPSECYGFRSFNMGRLTTHVLDTARGCPAAGLQINVFRHVDDKKMFPNYLTSLTTNADGRSDAPLLQGDEFIAGRYRLVFAVADYLRQNGDKLPDVPFLEDVVIDFGIDQASQHYHVPLLLSAYGYSTYRGC